MDPLRTNILPPANPNPTADGSIRYRVVADFVLSPEEVERLKGDGIDPGSLGERVGDVLEDAHLGAMTFRGKDGTRYVFDVEMESVCGEVPK